MGLGGWLFGDGVKATGEGVNALLGGVGELAKDVRTAITGKDPAAEAKIAEIEAKLATAQTEINKVEAHHPSIFVAGWRPFIGWVGGAGLAYHFIAHPLLLWLSVVLAANNYLVDLEPPTISAEGLITIVLALLGLATARTVEKKFGVSDKH